MNTLPDQSSSDYRSRLLRPTALPHQPAVPALIALALGIVCDRHLDAVVCVGVSLTMLALSLIAIFVVQSGQRQRRMAVVALSLWFCLGSVRHYLFWTVSRPDEVSLCATDTPRPIELVGTILSRPAVRYAESTNDELSRVQRLDQTSCYIECEQLAQRPVTGRARLTVIGQLTNLGVGDQVQVYGSIAIPPPASNPGEFDYREYLRRQGAKCIIRSTHPESIVLLKRARWWNPQRAIGSLRQQAQIIIDREMSDEVLPIASAILLGSRDRIDDDLRTAFVESGTMHLLAISGLHVGILAYLILMMCRMTGLSSTATTAVLIGCIFSYTMIAEARPPVVRASILIMIAAIGRPVFRKTSLTNMLAIAGICLLIWNPTDLFDVGARLSFLAVAGIALAVRIRPVTVDVDEDIARQGQLSILDRLQNWFARQRSTVAQAMWMMAGITILTSPLVAKEFHIVSPIGMVMNIGLIAIVGPVLWCGYAMLFCGFLIPPLTPLFAWGFELGLQFLLAVAEFGSAIELGHFYVKGPEWWWLTGHFLLAALPLCVFISQRRMRGWWVAILMWTVIGQVSTLLPVGPEGLRCTFISVGHGLSIFVESPNGRCLLYDCGTIGSTRRATGATSATVWSQGRNSIDCVLVSHADLDHFNGLPQLFDAFTVGQLLTTDRVATQDGPTTRALFAAARAHEIRVSTISRGDEILLDPAVQIRVLHPEAGSQASSDNADSLTLIIEYSGRRILLTGDLEEDGLESLMRNSSPHPDVMLSPHHGSRGANTHHLAAWANTKWVIASCGRQDSVDHLDEVFADARVLATSIDGAVTFEISPDGKMTVQTFGQQ